MLWSIDDIVVIEIIIIMILLHILLNNRVVINLQSMKSYMTRVHEVVTIFSYICSIGVFILCYLL